MTRVDTRNHFQVSVRPSSAELCRFICVLIFIAFIAIAYLITKNPLDCLDDPSDQFLVKNIPATFTKLEGIDPEERDVFEGFRTSFLPTDEIRLAQRISKRDVNDENLDSDSFIWGNTDKNYETSSRIKRKTRFQVTSKDYGQDKQENPTTGSYEEQYYDLYNENDNADSRYKTSENNNNNRDKNAIFQEIYVDRGPLDDVVEQVRRQPELEEGEMGSSANLYKPSKSHSGIHAFWKGEGDRATIRETQASIMKQYMDAGADPCHDFYQYACGNWASLNPIPADKAGYDTFEMLRENLDTVLKELLEFKAFDHIESVYPGHHLDLSDNFLTQNYSITRVERHNNVFDIGKSNPPKNNENIISNTTENHDGLIQNNNADIISRIRRYLHKKSIYAVKALRKIKHKLNGNHKKNKKPKKGAHGDNHFFKYTKRNVEERKQSIVQYPKKTNVGRKLQMFYTRVKKKQGHEKFNKKKLINHIDDKNDPACGDAALKSRFLFKSCMNYEILEKRGHQPLLDLLDLLGGWPILNKNWNYSNFDWLELMAKLRVYNNDILISEWVGPDIKNSDEFVIQFDQTSLGLPTRDYFLQESNKVYLDAYKTYLTTIAQLLGGENEHVEKSVNKLIAFEINLARITSAPEDRRNVSEIYKRMSIRRLIELVPDIDWIKYLSIVMNKTINDNETVVLFAHNYVLLLIKLVEKTEADTLANYLLWRFVRHRVNNLDDRFQSAKQQFYYILFGREEAPPRWKNCISQVNSNMGMALGSMFVRKYFDEMSKNDTLTMTREIQQSFREILHMTEWIDGATKKLAGHKVNSMMLRIGYPDFILNKKELDDRYKEVKIHPDKYFENILNILQHLTKMEQSRIGQPVNKSLWNTAPAVVNAYYSRNKNQIMFPAGILQPPFYHRHFPRSLNYGGIGVVIGHEITHGFDDKGRLFDCEGNLHRWWSDPAIEAFHHRAQCLIDQYGQYTVPEVNMRLDGVNTQGENIADNGGVKQAFHAYLKWLRKHGAHDETLPGLNHTHTQLFFLNFAQVWCGAMRPEAMRNKLKTAVHSPGRFRVIGTLSNSEDFAKEFNCPPGSPMNPTQKCSVW